MTQRVLYVNTPTYTGGAEISLLTLMRHLDPSNYAPLLVTSGEGQLATTARGYGIETFILEFPWYRKRYPWRYPGSIFRLSLMMQKHQVVLAHTNCDHSLRYVGAACRLLSAPYVCHVRDATRSWFEPSNLKTLNDSYQVIANSEATARICISRGVRAEKVQVVDNPIDIERFAEPNANRVHSFHRSLGIPEGGIVFGVIGQVYPLKGQDDFIRASALIADTLPLSHFLIVGSTPTPEAETFLKHLKLMACEQGIGHRVHFLGHIADVPDVLAALDVLVAPHVPKWSDALGDTRLQVGYGRVILEAMAAGRPVIASSIEGLSEVLVNKQNGLSVTPQDSHALAEAMLMLAHDPELRLKLSLEGKKTVQRFSAKRHAVTIQAIYDGALGMT